jgi:hypothetical protein
LCSIHFAGLQAVQGFAVMANAQKGWQTRVLPIRKHEAMIQIFDAPEVGTRPRPK